VRMSRLAPLLLAVLLPACGSDDGAQAWKLTWSDEVEGPAGRAPDAANWQYDIGTDWGNDQLEFDTDRTENVALDGAGHLAITARKEPWQNREYTSGRINTRDRFAQARGRFEARLRLPVGQGLWPAFWLLGNDFAQVGWPACGEIDIMEYRGQAPNTVLGSLHGPGYSGGQAVGGQYQIPGAGFHEDFHVFAVEWDTDRITWFVDDVRYRTITTRNLPGGARWVFDHPFFIILNVAVGGRFVGAPDAQTTFPQTMLVDYVRVYER